MKIGDRVRIVQMNGCMADVRTDPREGVVIGFVNQLVYGASHPIDYVRMTMDDGTYEERPARAGLWSYRYDGVAEYQE